MTVARTWDTTEKWWQSSKSSREEDNGPAAGFIAGSRIPESGHFQICKHSPLLWNSSFYQSPATTIPDGRTDEQKERQQRQQRRESLLRSVCVRKVCAILIGMSVVGREPTKSHPSRDELSIGIFAFDPEYFLSPRE